VRQCLRAWLIEFAQACAARGHLAIDDVEAELPHVYAAVLDAAADGPAAQIQALELVVALRRHWELDTRSGPPLAVLRALEAALPHVHDADQRCQASLLLSVSLVLAGLPNEALPLAHSALALATQAVHRSYALFRLTLVKMFSGADISGVDESLVEAVALAQQAGDLEAQALAMRTQFLVATNRDDNPAQGERLAQQVQALWEQVGHRRNAYGGLMDRASCWIKLGRQDEAATALAACEQAALQERYATGSIMSSWQLGRVSLRLGQAPAALAAFRRCLQQSWDLKRLAYVADALLLTPGGLAFTGLPGDAENAVRLHGFAEPHWQRHFGALYRELARDVRTTRRWLRQHVGSARFETLRLEGACLSLAEAVALGLGSTRPAMG
jgi:tetratricopeptide (TPR) repeat protein